MSVSEATARRSSSASTPLDVLAERWLREKRAADLARQQEQKPETVSIELPPSEWTSDQVEKFLGELRAQDERLYERGFHRITAWWWKEIDRFFREGLAKGKRRWVIRVGRRGGKSTTIIRILVAWALSGMWGIGPGETAVIPIISKDEGEAADRLQMVEAILEARGLVKGKSFGRGDFSSSSEAVEVSSRKMRFEVYAPRKPVGFTGIAFYGDEVAHWKSGDGYTNPADEVMSLARPSLASQPLAFEILCSAPWGTDDFHAKSFDEGETDEQCVSYAPTWVANDNYVSEARTRQLEKDPRKWSVAYLAIPGATLTKAFDPSDVRACFGLAPQGELREGFLGLDPSDLKEDGFAYSAGRTSSRGEIVVREVGAWELEEIRAGVDFETICEDLKAVADNWGVGEVFTDQCEQAAVSGYFHRRNKLCTVYDWGNASKEAAFTLLRRLMVERRLCLPPVEDGDESSPAAVMRREMLEVKEKRTPGGRSVFETRGLDYLSTLITLAHAANDGRLRILEGGGLDKEDFDDWLETGKMRPAAGGL